ncbi:hypothetical protein FB45DRAFT_290922 [Roridomyces roridus]|uniref:VPS37 C-terminal domain-containing protein n=1 Tax=Roridomyces roridus TaxID=1738132 RepID=A0AAD7CBF4_9AGAR|nr:hypothetical protein FB45DRAFT_290922 [Roridomyces roridus]
MTTPLFHDFPELSHFSREDLEDLLNDHVYFQAVFHSLPRVKAMYESQAELGMANESIARHNLALQEPLYNLRAETKQAFDDAKNLEARWREVDKEQREVYQRFNAQFLLMRLKHSKTEQDDASEALASDFVQQSPTSGGSGTPNGGMGREIDEFVKEYKNMRKTYHKRVIWEDRWSTGLVNWRDD